MSLYSQYETDKDKEVNGVWIESAPNDDGTIPKFRIARMGNLNKRYSKVSEHKTKPYKRQIELEIWPEEKAEEVFKEVFAETVLLEWENVQDRNGKILAYNKENVIQVMTDLPELYGELRTKARAAAMFKIEELEADAKN